MYLLKVKNDHQLLLNLFSKTNIVMIEVITLNINRLCDIEYTYIIFD